MFRNYQMSPDCAILGIVTFIVGSLVLKHNKKKYYDKGFQEGYNSGYNTTKESAEKTYKMARAILKYNQDILNEIKENID